MIRGIRGATTVTANRAEEIQNVTKELMEKLIKLNNIEPSDVASVFVSVTGDIDSGFPAKAVRTLPGWNYVPVMCMLEMPVPNSLPLCIRVMCHVNTEISQKDIQHVYLNDAVLLRPDLKNKA